MLAARRTRACYLQDCKRTSQNDIVNFSHRDDLIAVPGACLQEREKAGAGQMASRRRIVVKCRAEFSTRDEGAELPLYEKWMA